MVSEQTCVHEAGHAVVATLVGLSFEHVTVEADGWAYGHLLSRFSKRQCEYLALGLDWFGDDPEFIEFCEAEVMVCLAGDIAASAFGHDKPERKIDPLDLPEPEFIEFKARLERDGLPGPDDEELARQSAAALFRTDASVIGGEDPEQIERYVEERRVKVRDLVNRNIVAIARVVRELETRLRLSEADVRALVEEGVSHG